MHYGALPRRRELAGCYHREFLHLCAVIIGILLCLVCACAAFAQGPLPFAVENRLKPKDAEQFDERLAVEIYFAVARSVAHELNPVNPKDIRPQFTLILDPKERLVRYQSIDKNAILALPAWNAGLFAQGVAVAALGQALSCEELADAAMVGERHALAKRYGVVGVEELRR